VTIAAERICAVVDRRRRLGGVAGSSAARQLLQASCSRDADPFAVQTMDRLARAPAPLTERLLRVAGGEGKGALSILATHPLTGERLETLKQAAGPAKGPPLLSPQEWDKLRAICGG
jgi:predicted Zn-dependent protease